MLVDWGSVFVHPLNNQILKLVFPLLLCIALYGLPPIKSVLGFQYYLVILDDFSHYAWTFPLRRNSKVFPIITRFHAFLATQFQRSIVSFQTDNGKEFDNNAVSCDFFAQNGIHLRLSCPYTSQQNGRAKRIL